MDLYRNLKLTNAIYHKGKSVSFIYKGTTLIWKRAGAVPVDPSTDLILSCYSNGYWSDEYPWNDDQIWTD